MSISAEQVAALAGKIPGVLLYEPMSKHTNFRIGGPARLYAVAPSADALLQMVHAAIAENVPWYVFGGGSNLLVADEGFDGLAIQAGMRGITVEGDQMKLESGVITALAARKAADANLTGFEWAIGVPGTIGGAIYGNAGCYGGEMKDVVVTVDAIRLSDGQRVTYTNAECAFGYRESRFKRERHLILGCTIKLTPGDGQASKKRMQEIVEMRKAKQPLELSSAGCAFKNAELSSSVTPKIALPEAMRASGVVSAGWAVDQSGARGWKEGNVAVSDKHGNFLVNLGGGTARDVLTLLTRVKNHVREQIGVELHEEVQLLGFEEKVNRK